MPRESSASLSPAEWKVMKIVWQLKSGAARDIYEVAGREYGWAASTVKTMLRRLVEKGFLTYTQVGNSYLYRPARQPLKSLLGAADALLANALDGTLGPLLAYMVKKGNLSPAELTQLRELLEGTGPDQERKS
jgi:BlaI family transcriptional regulator, penicillinase repressor